MVSKHILVQSDEVFRIHDTSSIVFSGQFESMIIFTRIHVVDHFKFHERIISPGGVQLLQTRLFREAKTPSNSATAIGSLENSDLALGD